ncbi:hypothetical protein ACERK3_02320 [Phycisphaerales bacterium AB-hyl4]|uniref:ASCH domain-containing protein n=1 Tax=Natronomicrosphaera hydrolytica TaxID=3242702 RepID=A0ABV4U0J0_9BACT
MAILQRPYVRAVLAGRKTVESRLTKSAVEPYGVVRTGERLFIKASGGPFMATAVAGRVMFFEALTPSAVVRLRERFDARVCGDDVYWQAKRASRYATFVELREVAACDVGPSYGRSAYKAWHVLADEASPWLEVALTAGALRNGYVSVAGRSRFFGEGTFELMLPRGDVVQTTLYRDQRVRWRGWRALFADAGVVAGDRVRFVMLGGRRYGVAFACANAKGLP